MTAASFDDVFGLRQDALRCPYGAYRTARRDDPVFWSDRLGAHVVTRYDDVLEVLRQPELFSSAEASGPRSVTPIAARLVADPETPARLRAQAERRLHVSKAAVLLNCDPPTHVRQRKLVNKGFTARRVNGMADEIRRTAEELVDGFAAAGEVELVSRFSVELPMTVIAELLGVPHDLHGTFKRWSDAFTAGTGNLDLDGAEVAAMFAAVDEFYDYFTDQIQQRRAEPRDDLLTDVVTARIGGEEPLSLEEMLQMLVQFLVAGNETTTNLLTTIVYRLVTDADLMSRVRSDLNLVEPFVEEVLRAESPVQGLFRRARSATTVGGVDIPDGGLLWLAYGSANRDSAAFPSGEDITLDRTENQPHLAFGRGEHFCLGAGLARLEARIGIQTLLHRLDDPALVGDAESVRWLPNFVLHGISELPLTFRAS